MESKIPSGCPYAGGDAPTAYGKSDLSYNDYLKVPELLSLQHPLSSPAHHDELLFIVIHQAYELWFKLILHELERVVEQMGEAQVLKARHHMARVVEIMKVLVSQIHILETMAPADFLSFRGNLMPASGFQSLQFREMEFLAGLKDERYFGFFAQRPEVLAVLQARFNAPDLRTVYFEMLRKLGFQVPADAWEREREDDPARRQPTVAALLPIYRKPEDHFPLYVLTEAMMDFDQELGLWREHHVRVVERVIGFKRGTGGSSGVGYLQSTTHKKCFPSLWELRTELEVRV